MKRLFLVGLAAGAASVQARWPNFRAKRALTDCPCPNGTPSADCDDAVDVSLHAESCSACNSGYHIENNGSTGFDECIQDYDSICPNSVDESASIDANSQTTQNVVFCIPGTVCDSEYYLSGNECVVRFDSTCTAGTLMLKSQTSANVEACSACQSGYHLEDSGNGDGNNVCVEDYDGVCDHGDEVTQQYDTTGVVSCIEGNCDSGYHHESILDGLGADTSRFNCIADYDGICTNGVAVTGAYETNDVVSCASCNSGYHPIAIGATGLNDCEQDFECDCVHGTAPTDCITADQQKCEINTCDTSTSFVSTGNNGDYWCQPYYTCVCEYGTPMADCTDDTTVSCQAGQCNDGYRESPTGVGANNDCIANVCICDNGVATTGGGCLTHNVVSCDTCNPGYVFEDPTVFDQQDFDCESIVCPCLKGTGYGKEGISEGQCTVELRDDNDFKVDNCQSCDAGYELQVGAELNDRDLGSAVIPAGQEALYNALQHCVPTTCACNNGTPQIADPDNGGFYKCAERVQGTSDPLYEVCISCNDFYHIDDSSCTDCQALNPDDGLCVENVCFCGAADASLGTPVANNACNEHQTSQCSACDAAWHHVDANEQCVQNTCTCTNGDESTGNDCTKEQGHMCGACNDYYHLETQAPDGDGWSAVHCVPNVCTCNNGDEVDSGNCWVDNANECKEDQCDDYYHSECADNADGIRICSCVANVCTCTGGTQATTGSNCWTHENEECQSCNNFYHDDTNADADGNMILTCPENECICTDGTPVDNSICTTHQAEQCDQCDDFHHIDGLLCVDNVCNCLHGTTVPDATCINHNGDECVLGTCDNLYFQVTPADNEPCNNTVCVCPLGTPDQTQCTVNGATVCASCDADHHHVDAAFQCVQNVCLCDNGNPKTGTECTDHNTNMCADCNDFYHINGEDCDANVCTCADQSGNNAWTGTPHGVGECNVHNANECASCDSAGYHVPADTYDSANPDASLECEAKVCVCANGASFAKADGACDVHGDNQCTDCDEYYHLSTYETDTDNCNANVCTCTGGTAAGVGECDDHDTEQCMDCDDFGYTVDVSTGGCKANECICESYYQGEYTSMTYGIGRGTAEADAKDDTLPRCSAEGASECAFCDDGSDPDSLGQFWHVDTYSDPSAPSYLRCVPNVCWCVDGDPKGFNACPEHWYAELGDDYGEFNEQISAINGDNGGMGHFCDVCDTDDMVIDDFLHCVNKPCACQNGLGEATGRCNEIFYHICESCQTGYKIDSTSFQETIEGVLTDVDRCVPNVCVCDHGTELNNGDCQVDGEIGCVLGSCDNGYHYDTATKNCLENICYCDNGVHRTGTTSTVCSDNGAHECISCDLFYNADTDPVCTANVCVCADGTPVNPGACMGEGVTQCAACTDDTYFFGLVNILLGHYHTIDPLDDSNWPAQVNCIAKVCTCENGNELPAGSCTHDGENMCIENDCEAGYHSEDNVRGGFDCVANVCVCPLGTARTGTDCTTHGATLCETCTSPGMRTDAGTAWQCTQNICGCTNGVGVTGEECTLEGANYCASCTGNYHLDTHATNAAKLQCDENECVCTINGGGTQVANAVCTEDGGEQCQSCTNVAYTPEALNDGTDDIPCQPKQCACTNGVGVRDGTCDNVATEKCASCNTDYELHASADGGDDKCYPVCECDNGPAKLSQAGECTGVNDQQCQNDCDDGYRFVQLNGGAGAGGNDVCLPNECTCTNGVGLDDGNCPVHNQPGCASCNDFYHLEGNDPTAHTCEENVCRCDEGDVVANNACNIHRETQCTACHDIGYKVDELERCSPKCCTCETEINGVMVQNGVGVHDGTCVDENMNRCNQCYAGYKLEWTEESFYKLKYVVDDPAINYTVFNDANNPDNFQAEYAKEETKVYWAETCVDLNCPNTHYFTMNECLPKECYCDNGLVIDSCTYTDSTATAGAGLVEGSVWVPHHECQSCDQGFMLDGSNHCVPHVNTCNCEWGEPAYGTDCLVDGGHQCESCSFPGFSVNADSHCVHTVCTCDDGEPVADGTCMDSADQRCVECNEGFDLTIVYKNDGSGHYEEHCVAGLVCDATTEHVEIDEDGNRFCAHNVCLCENGNAYDDTTASPCTKHLGFMCDTCYAGFQIKEYVDQYDSIVVFDRTCELIHISPVDDTNCWCDFGHEATFDECAVDAHHCVECYTTGYIMDADNVCVPRVCDCDNGHGVSDGTCFMDGVQHCVECDEGYMMEIQYHMDDIHYNHVCVEIPEPTVVIENICNCAFGEPKMGADCLVDGAHSCESCHHEGYVVNADGHCETRVCKCVNGWGIADGSCMDDDMEMCVQCYEGYELSLEMLDDGKHYKRFCNKIETPVVSPSSASTPTVVPSASTPTVVPSASTPTVVPSASTPTVVPSASTPTVVPSASTPTVVPSASTPTVVPSASTPTASAISSCGVGFTFNGATCDPVEPLSLVNLGTKKSQTQITTSMPGVCLSYNGTPEDFEGDLVLMNCADTEDNVAYVATKGNQKGQIALEMSFHTNKRCVDYDASRRTFFIVSCKKVVNKFVVQKKSGDKFIALQGAADGDYVTVDYYDF